MSTNGNGKDHGDEPMLALVEVTAQKLEATNRHVDVVDDDLAKVMAKLEYIGHELERQGEKLTGVQRDVLSLKTDMTELKAKTEMVPDIKNMLAEVLDRLPRGGA